MSGRKGGLAYAPLAAVAALACVVFIGALLLGARDVDGTERRQEELSLSQELPRRLTELSHLKSPFVLWDEALKHLDGPVNAEWADENLKTMTAKGNIAVVMVLDHADRPAYAADARGPSAAAAVAALATAAAPLVARVRAQEASSTPPPRNQAILDVAVREVAGKPSIVIATLVRSDTGRLKPIFGRAPVLVVQESVEISLRRLLAQRYMLHDLRSETVSGRTPDSEAEVVLASFDGGRRSVLRWRPKTPGHELLMRAALPLALAGLLVLAAGVAVALHARRVTHKLIESQAEARRLALHDALTGLANRLLFRDRLTQARERLRRTGNGVIGLLCLDLDHFKDVNDTWGHEAGDELIREVGRRLEAVCRAEDTVARLGGDEFAVVACANDTKGVAVLAERMVETLSGAVQLSAAQVRLSSSIGVTVLTDGEIDQAEALRQADFALYRSKARGRGRYTFFEPEMDAALRSRKQLETQLKAAVKAEAVELDYQPIVCADGRVLAVEALARWTHPLRGPIPPGVFIPLAEESGIIGELSSQLFRRACLQTRTWGDVRMAFNVSLVQLRRSGMIERVEAALAATGANPLLIDLEITEDALLQDDAMTHDVLGALRHLGFRLVLDNFGTGYSSLSHLHRYPVQKIKLDRALIARLGVAPEAPAIVAALIRMAAALSLQVVAEGVETITQFEMLGGLGCSEFQGFLFSPPISPGAINALLSDDRPLLPPANVDVQKVIAAARRS